MKIHISIYAASLLITYLLTGTYAQDSDPWDGQGPCNDANVISQWPICAKQADRDPGCQTAMHPLYPEEISARMDCYCAMLTRDCWYASIKKECASHSGAEKMCRSILPSCPSVCTGARYTPMPVQSPPDGGTSSPDDSPCDTTEAQGQFQACLVETSKFDGCADIFQSDGKTLNSRTSCPCASRAVKCMTEKMPKSCIFTSDESWANGCAEALKDGCPSACDQARGGSEPPHSSETPTPEPPKPESPSQPSTPESCPLMLGDWQGNHFRMCIPAFDLTTSLDPQSRQHTVCDSSTGCIMLLEQLFQCGFKTRDIDSTGKIDHFPGMVSAFKHICPAPATPNGCFETLHIFDPSVFNATATSTSDSVKKVCSDRCTSPVLKFKKEVAAQSASTASDSVAKLQQYQELCTDVVDQSKSCYSQFRELVTTRTLSSSAKIVCPSPCLRRTWLNSIEVGELSKSPSEYSTALDFLCLSEARNLEADPIYCSSTVKEAASLVSAPCIAEASGSAPTCSSQCNQEWTVFTSKLACCMGGLATLGPRLTLDGLFSDFKSTYDHWIKAVSICRIPVALASGSGMADGSRNFRQSCNSLRETRGTIGINGLSEAQVFQNQQLYYSKLEVDIARAVGVPREDVNVTRHYTRQQRSFVTLSTSGVIFEYTIVASDEVAAVGMKNEILEQVKNGDFEMTEVRSAIAETAPAAVTQVSVDAGNSGAETTTSTWAVAGTNNGFSIKQSTLSAVLVSLFAAVLAVVIAL
eukprot:TRINITY_DN1315_c0_g1_i1.p1 TRINITY_DN1315_c0_g1~~TRINITY_DN1315_c0_g1_i1.p1  ORF type:complete len:754 (+),score=29.56 TRINITY_DN1315_c0_g1_i1:203-2464(+)